MPGQTHAPAVHTADVAHACPHDPQWSGSESRFAHAVVQSVSAPGQLHVPPLHTASAAHAWPHVPQWSVLVEVS